MNQDNLCFKQPTKLN